MSSAAVEPEGAPDDETPLPFGQHPVTRYGADVTYRGRVAHRDYVVAVRHRLFDTSFTLSIDGVWHDPKQDPTMDKEVEHEGESGDGLRFRLRSGVREIACTVRRPQEDGDHKEAEVVTVRTAGLGGAGEVDVRSGFQVLPLAPDEGSPSAIRDRKRIAHPTRYALLAALSKGVTYLLPLLGLGALLSGLLDPVIAWIAGLVRPAWQWIGTRLQPVWDFIGAVTQPVRDVVDWALQPLRSFVAWLRELLRFDLSLPFAVPEWVGDVAVPLIVVAAVFVATFRGLRRRHERLEAARAAPAEPVVQADVKDKPGGQADADAGDRSSPA